MDLSASAGPSLHHHALFTPHSSHRHPPNYASSLSSAATRPSALNFNHHQSPYPLPSTILTRADIRDSVDTFAAMLAAAKAYRSALMALSSATSAFAKALEDCARLKGAQSSLSDLQPIPSTRPQTAPHSLHGSIAPEDNELRGSENLSPGERLLAASGLHFMTANLEQVLSATFYKSFEIPLLDVYDAHRRQLAERQASYDTEVLHKTETIRDTELRNMYQGPHRRQRRSPRDLDSFRRGLRELQDQVEDLERIKQAYYLELAGEEREIWKTVADNIGLVVKSEVEVYDRIASKPTSDPTLESMVSAVPDPFDAYKDPSSASASPGQPAEIYTILPPLSSILSGPPAPARLEPRGHPGSCSPTSLPDHAHLDATAHWGDAPAPSHVPFPDSYTPPTPGPSALFHSPPPSPTDALPAHDWPASASSSHATHLRNVLSLASTDSGATITLTATFPCAAPGGLPAVDEPAEPSAEMAETLAGPSHQPEPEHVPDTPPGPQASPAPVVPSPAPPLPPYAMNLTPATPVGEAPSEAVGKPQMVNRLSMTDSLADLCPKRSRGKRRGVSDGEKEKEGEAGGLNGQEGQTGGQEGLKAEAQGEEEEDVDEEESLLGQQPPSGIDSSDSEA